MPHYPTLYNISPLLYQLASARLMDERMDGQTDTQTNRQTYSKEKGADIHTDRQTDVLSL